MSQRSIEVKVGFLILVALGLLAGFVVVMGGLSLQPTFTVYVSFQNPGGLQSGAPIRIAGVKVGRVSELEFRGGMVDPVTHQPEPIDPRGGQDRAPLQDGNPRQFPLVRDQPRRARGNVFGDRARLQRSPAAQRRSHRHRHQPAAARSAAQRKLRAFAQGVPRHHQQRAEDQRDLRRPAPHVARQRSVLRAQPGQARSHRRQRGFAVRRRPTRRSKRPASATSTTRKLRAFSTMSSARPRPSTKTWSRS